MQAVIRLLPMSMLNVSTSSCTPILRSCSMVTKETMSTTALSMPTKVTVSNSLSDLSIQSMYCSYPCSTWYVSWCVDCRRFCRLLACDVSLMRRIGSMAASMVINLDSFANRSDGVVGVV
ncbi:hypothetical protein FB192DRAFT_1382251 [Mucor lusitanicus]|uniref:Uncharacterized protein n=1 Tax=Mucor circinelloides f. lusitanicus TaxID=29924 RepID=A0A8H4F0S1_MUCCL|nr:hypothetical protein FB192DRAFT_1382251 [Mucor lusitanicus]